MPEVRRVVEFDEARFLETGELFPEDIAEDPWTAYHGTGGAVERSIDADGFCWHPTIYSRADVESVVRIYERLRWAGIHPGGFAALLPFSLRHDFANIESKPIFFAESGARAATFATADFAGGETARALRHAIDDLGRYLGSGEVREEHQARVKRGDVLVSVFGALLESAPIPLRELEEDVRKLAPLRRRCGYARQATSHGVVYAVQFCEADVPQLEHHATMGIKAHAPVSPSKIVAKVRVRSDLVVASAKQANCLRLPILTGLLMHIARARREGLGP